MAHTSHGEPGTTRPGSFGFPVVLATSADQKPFGAASVSRSTGVFAGGMAKLLLIHWTGVSLGRNELTMAACLAILLFGLPHGTLDLEIIKRERGTGRVGMLGLLGIYLGLAAAMATMWQLAPVGALAMFVVVAVIHFAEDWADLGSAFLAQGMAIALLTAPALLHLADLEHLFVALSGRGEAALVANLMLLLAPMSASVAGVAIAMLWRTGFRNQAVVGTFSLAGMILLPPVIGFACFFCLVHSPRHLGMAFAQTGFAPGSRWMVPLVTLAALGISAVLFAADPRSDMSARVIAASFMTLSVLTVPHMMVPFVVDVIAGQRSRAPISDSNDNRRTG